jgi:DNA primase
LNGSIPDCKDEVRRRADIVSLIGEHVTLKKAGRNYLGLCPFHQEKTPSFNVSPEKQIFHCYGCGEGGDVFSFLMKFNQLTFPEALRQLARKVGVVIPEKPLGREAKERYTLKEQILKVNEIAAGHFVGTLQSPAGEGARAYLRRRGIGEEAVRTFRLGFAPERWRDLLDHLGKKGISGQLAEQAGLVVQKAEQKEGGYYDRFRGRLMIPIEDADGRVIAFGGRLMQAVQGQPKYLNSPESPVYTKGNNLFGLSRTREAIRDKGFAILVEGYFDLIALWNAGITHGVATLGTALTRAQVDLLRRYATRVAAVFDPDAAGRKALARSLELFLAGNVHARAVILPEGYDPDDYVRTQGREKMEAALAQAQPMVDYYIEEILGGRGTLEEDRDKLREAVAFVSRIGDAVERNLFIKKISETLRVDQEVLKAEVKRVLTGTPVPAADRLPTKATAVMDPLELELIRMMLEYPDRIPVTEAAGALTCFRAGPLRSLGEAILTARTGAGWDAGDVTALVTGLPADAIREKLLDLMLRESPYPEAMMDRLFVDTIGRIRLKWYRERQRLLQQKMNKAQEVGNRALCDALLAEKDKLAREEKDLCEAVKAK